MKCIKNIDEQIVMYPGGPAFDWTYRKWYSHAIGNALPTAGSPIEWKEGIELHKLTEKITAPSQSPDLVLEDAQYELLKKWTQKNQQGHIAYIYAQVVMRLDAATEVQP